MLPLPTHRPLEPAPFCKAFYFHIRTPLLRGTPGPPSCASAGGGPGPHPQGPPPAPGPLTPVVPSVWGHRARTHHQARSKGGHVLTLNRTRWHHHHRGTRHGRGHRPPPRVGCGWGECFGIFFSLFLYLQNSWLLPPGWGQGEPPLGMGSAGAGGLLPTLPDPRLLLKIIIILMIIAIIMRKALWLCPGAASPGG